jgi:hypothetical protein
LNNHALCERKERKRNISEKIKQAKDEPSKKAIEEVLGTNEYMKN